MVLQTDVMPCVCSTDLLRLGAVGRQQSDLLHDSGTELAVQLVTSGAAAATGINWWRPPRSLWIPSSDAFVFFSADRRSSPWIRDVTRRLNLLFFFFFCLGSIPLFSRPRLNLPSSLNAESSLPESSLPSLADKLGVDQEGAAPAC